MRTIILLACVAFASALFTRGSIEKDDFEFMEKFCFANNANGTMEFHSESDIEGLQLVIYTDVLWDEVYPENDGMTCEEKLAKATDVYPLEQHTKIIFRSYFRPYYWFMAIGSCGKKISLDYNVTFLNMNGGSWKQQFSYDVQDLLETYLIFAIAYAVVFLIHIFLCWRMTRGGVKLHTALRMFTLAIILEGLSCLTIFMHYMNYAGNGVGLPFIFFVGQALDIASQLTLLVIIMLLAKGWTIATTTLDVYDRKVIGGTFISFTVCYIVLLFWEKFGEDRAATTYFYNTAPGIIICILRGALLVWFVFTLRGTYKKEPDWDKLKFYMSFGVVYTAWLMALPLLVFISFFIPSWIRYKIIDALLLTVHTLGLACMGFLLHPSKAQHIFSMTMPTVAFGDFAPYDEVL